MERLTQMEAPEQLNTPQPQEPQSPAAQEPAPGQQPASKPQATPPEKEGSAGRRPGPMSKADIDAMVRNEVNKAVAPLHRQLNEEKAARELAEAAARWGEESDQYKQLQGHFARQDAEQRLHEERLSDAREYAEFYGVPAELLEGIDAPDAVRAVTKTWRTASAGQRGAAEQPGPEPVEPVPSQTVTQGGGVGSPVQSPSDWLTQYSDEVNGNIPHTAENAKKAKDLMDAGYVPRPPG